MTTPQLPTGKGTLHQRERELELIESALIDAKAAESRLVLIEGRAGIGKSRLLLEMRRLAESAGFAVVTARGYEYQRDYAFGMLRQLIDNAQREDGENEVSDNADAADELMRAFAGDHGEAASTFAIFEGCYWATVRAAESTPILMAVDDLQWGDRPSLEYLAYLARRIESLPIVIAATIRTADGAAASAPIRDLMSDPSRLSVAPQPLGEAAVAAMTMERLGVESPDAGFVGELAEITGGNPLFVDELLKALAAEQVAPTVAQMERLRELGPRAASRSVLLRLARLDDACTSVVRALTILGEGTPDAMLAEFTGLGEDAVAAAIADSVRAEILRSDTPLGFVHPLVRQAVYNDIPAGERELAHMNAARRLDAAGASSERVAAQLLSVPPRADEWVFEKLRHAGGIALSRHVVSSAVSYFERALAEPPPRERRAESLRDLALAQALVNSEEAADNLLEAWDLIEDPVQRGFIAVAALRILGLAQRNPDAVDLAERTLEALGDDQPALRHRIENGLLSVSLMDPDARPLSLLEPELEDTDSRGNTVEARMTDGALGYGKMLRGDPAPECVELALRSVADDQLFEFDNGGFALIGTMVTLASADDDRALDICDRSMEFAGSGGSPLYAPAVARGFKGLALILRGDLQAAFEALELAKADIKTFDMSLGYTQISAMLTLACVERGDLVRAEAELALGEPHAVSGVQRIAWLGAKLHLLVEQSKNAEAVALAEQIEREAPAFTIANPGWLAWRSLKAIALDGLDRSAEAVELVEDELAAARRWGAPRALGRALRVHGQLLRREGIEEIEQSVELLRDSPAVLEYARSLVALGTALRHERRALDAREPLVEALQIAVRTGAARLERLARDELAASGAAPRASDFQGLDALTPSERRVAALAVEGMTNREIAQKLFVTPKTIEVHLSNVYKKLDIKSRRELPGVYVPEGAG